MYGVRKGFLNGFGLAIVYLLMFGAYGLGFYFGTLFVFNGEFGPADMVTVRC